MSRLDQRLISSANPRGGLVETALHTAREVLGMELAYLADTRAGMQDYRALVGDAGSFGASRDDPVPLEGTYCGLVISRKLDGLVTNAPLDPRVSGLPITERAGIGSYVGVPVHLPGGELFGTFCCLSHDPDPTLRERDLRFMSVLARMVGEQIHREQLLAEDHRLALNEAHISALLAALEARDGYTEKHSQEVVALAVEIAQELGTAPESLPDLRCAALLHDIGKIGVSDAILRKPGKLTAEEWREMRTHPVIGERLVTAMPGLAHLAPVVRAEHERWDGQGYPDGLAGQAIPELARIILIADAFHAMTSDRPYREAMPVVNACAELRAHAGGQFWPDGVSAALTILSRRHSSGDPPVVAVTATSKDQLAA